MTVNRYRPRSLMESGSPTEFLSRETCQALFKTVLDMTSGRGETTMSLVSQWKGSSLWARNRMKMAGDIRSTEITIQRFVRGCRGSVVTSRSDEAGLREAVRMAEDQARFDYESPEVIVDPYVDQPTLQPQLWNESTYQFGAESRADMVRQLIDPAEQAGMISAGGFNITATGTATMTSLGMSRYYASTEASCSITVRNAQGTASGWAGVNQTALARLDSRALAARALDKAQRSVNPQAIEPGRYTVILEPQATADLMVGVIEALRRVPAENGNGPFAGRVIGRSKIGEQVLDRRMTLRADPMDPDGGFVPYERFSGAPYQAVAWIDRGILRELAYDRYYALTMLGYDKALPESGSYRLTAAPGVPTIDVDEMIARTERGLLVTRFHGVEVVDSDSVLCTGYTRDGLWLIENGKITRPVKNFRFTESPLFVLNKLLDIGDAVRVFRPGKAWIAPAVRVEDFSFTSLADAV